MSSVLDIHGLSLETASQRILDNIHFELEQGGYCCVLGPNGAGKSSLLKIIMGITSATSGDIDYRHQPLSALSQKQRARLISYVPQRLSHPLHFTVDEFIRMSRYPHQRQFAQWQPEDSRAVEHAITVTHLESFTHRKMVTLSGGEAQRVMIAAALCQQSPIMLLDEPGTSLDPHHQTAIQHLIYNLNQQHQISIIEVTHDINHAVQHSQHILALKQGQVLWSGPADCFLDPQRLYQLYNQDFVLTTHPQSGKTIALNSEQP